MATPHISSNLNDIAKTVLMPGDPLRAKYIAEHYLTDVKEVNSVRNMFGYTGLYKGKKVTVFGSGMGQPSIGIYSYELYKFYNVENIIRIGSAGAYKDNIDVFDLVLASSAYSESNYSKTFNGIENHLEYPSDKLNKVIVESAKELNKKLFIGTIHSSDVFYHENYDYMNEVKKNECLAVEMESFALFTNAKKLNKNAACILTISDSLVTHKETTSEERQNSFNEMMEVALNACLMLD